MIRNYIFDFGNVLCEFNPLKITGMFVEDETTKKIISEVAFDRTYWDKLDKGHVSDDEVKAEISTRLYGDLGVLACRIYDNWINAISPIDEMISVVDDLQKKAIIYIYYQI